MPSTLAELYVEFRSVGLDKVSAETDALKGRLTAAGVQAGFAEGSLRSLGQKHIGVTNLMRSFKSGALTDMTAKTMQLDSRIAAINKMAQIGALQKMFKSGAMAGIIKEAAQLDKQLLTLTRRQEWLKQVAQVGLFRASMTRAGEAISGLGQQFSKLGMVSRRVLFGGIGMLGLLVRSALQGTKEGDELAEAFKELAKAAGGIFLPFVKQLTDGLKSLAKWFDGLSVGVKRTIGYVTLGALGLAALGAVIGPLLAALGGLVTLLGVVVGAVAALGAPILITVAAIGAVTAALGAAYLLWGNMSGSLEERITKVVERLLDLKSVAVGVTRMVGQVFSNLAFNVQAVLTGMSTGLTIFVNWFRTDWRVGIIESIISVATQFGRLGRIVNGVIAAMQVSLGLLGPGIKGAEGIKMPLGLKNPLEGVSDIFNEMMNEIRLVNPRLAGEIVGMVKNLFGGLPGDFKGTAKSKPRDLESLTGTWDRMLKGADDGKQLQQRQLARLDQIHEQLVRIAGMNPMPLVV
jgi:hypothetical protein